MTEGDHGFWQNTIALAIAFFAKDTLKFTYQKTISAVGFGGVKTEGDNMNEFLKLLEAKLKAQGMPEVEKMAEVVYSCVKDSALETASASPNALVKSIVPVAFMALDHIAVDAINKIDGQAG